MAAAIIPAATIDILRVRIEVSPRASNLRANECERVMSIITLAEMQVR